MKQHQAKSDTDLQQMEPDPLLERLDTVLPESKEQLAFVPTELPSTVEDILGALKRQPGIDGVSIGRQVTSLETTALLPLLHVRRRHL